MFDVLTTGAVVEEFKRTILDGRVQRLGMIDALTVAMEIYAQGKRWHLIASANSENPRVHLVDSMPSTDPNTITPFSLQLRKYDEKPQDNGAPTLPVPIAPQFRTQNK